MSKPWPSIREMVALALVVCVTSGHASAAPLPHTRAPDDPELQTRTENASWSEAEAAWRAAFFEELSKLEEPAPELNWRPLATSLEESRLRGRWQQEHQLRAFRAAVDSQDEVGALEALTRAELAAGHPMESERQQLAVLRRERLWVNSRPWLFGALGLAGLLALGAAALRESRKTRTTDAVHNPFVTGRPLRDFDLVFGRDAMLREVTASARQGRSTYLTGERRIGKTTLLIHAGEVLRGEGATVLFLDVAGTQGDAALQVIRKALEGAIRQLRRAEAREAERLAAAGPPELDDNDVEPLPTHPPPPAPVELEPIEVDTEVDALSFLAPPSLDEDLEEAVTERMHLDAAFLQSLDEPEFEEDPDTEVGQVWKLLDTLRPGAGDDSEQDDPELLIAAELSARGPLVFLVDEIDALDSASARVRAMIRHLALDPGGPGVLIGAGVGLDLSGDEEARRWGERIHTIRVEPLDATNARQLLTNPVAGSITWSDRALEAAIERSDGRPMRLQLFGMHLVDRITRANRNHVALTDVEAVEANVARSWEAIQDAGFGDELVPIDVDAAIYELGRISQEVAELRRLVEAPG